MPIVTVCGLPSSTPGLGKLKRDLKECVSAVRELNLRPDQVIVFYPADAMEENLGNELIIWVDGLFVKPERTQAVKNKLADDIKNIIVQFTAMHLPECTKVETLVRSFDPQIEGYAVQEREVY